MIAFTVSTVTIFQWPSRMLDDSRDYARRWMANYFPPPVEVALASLPLPLPDPPPCDLPRASARRLVRVRGHRPLRGRAGRPHREVNP